LGHIKFKNNEKIILIQLTILMISSFALKAQVAINTDGTDTNNHIMDPKKCTSRINIYHSTLLISFFLITQLPVTYAQSGFNCGDQILYGGQNYNTVQIGAHCWMAENLNIGTRIDGAGNQTNNSTIEKYCYEDLESNCDTYGGLYQWNETMQYVLTPGTQGICPDGWRIPTDDEWCTMEQEVDPTITCGNVGWRGIDGGGKLKEEGTAHWWYINAGGTNTSGFTALPAGQRVVLDLSFFMGINSQTWFWSSNETTGGGPAWRRWLLNTKAEVHRYSDGKLVGYSVRCLKFPDQVPVNTSLQDVFIDDGQTICYNATNTINLAGGGTYFFIQDGGNVTMIAGEKITILPNTYIVPGACFRGYTAPSGPFCNPGGSLPQSIANGDSRDSSERITTATKQPDEESFTIYPNPTSGRFMVELSGISSDQQVSIEICGMQGENVLKRTVTGEMQQEFSLENRPSGIYFIRIISGDMIETTKLIKR